MKRVRTVTASDAETLSATGGSESWKSLSPSSSTESQSKLVIGVASMDSKARSKPMRNILSRVMSKFNLQVVVFGDKTILDEPVEKWPICHFLISFYSTGFPLAKAIDYVTLRKPYCINNLLMQTVLMDRRLVLSILDHINVPTPNRLISNIDCNTAPELQLTEDIILHVKETIGVDISPDRCLRKAVVEQIDVDTIALNGKVLVKPFVEKPVSGEDHNIYIYYHSSQGGGVRKLFRKVGNKSSDYFPEISEIRRDGSYLYEEFMKVDNAEDVKVYTIGPNFAHAETRKSPVVDGIVRRNSEGKEVRYVTPLTEAEKEYSERVCRAFGQTVCGFDLLRADGLSYVIDVNGWSFVKGNLEYYDKCAEILGELCTNVAESGQLQCATTGSHGLMDNGACSPSTNVEGQWRLKAYLTVMRHGDRTPKQKFKFNFRTKPFMDLLNGLTEEVVLKTQEQLLIVSNACDMAIQERIEEESALQALRTILNFKSNLPGTKVQIKPSYNKTNKSVLEKVQLIVKWGGEFTHAGFHQSKDFGEGLRKEVGIVNAGVLEDVRIYSSSERRVLATAEVVARSLLDKDEIPEELIQINKEMLDDSNAAKEQIEGIKSRLQEVLNPHAATKLPTQYVPTQIQDPELYLEEMINVLAQVRVIMRDNFSKGGDFEEMKGRWCCYESPFLFQERWEKIFKDFCDVERSSFEPSKISELYDSIKYDLLHNREFVNIVFTSPQHGDTLLRALYRQAKVLFDFIGPQEYGVEPSEKLDIAIASSASLLKQLVKDLKDAQNSPQPCTRIYFTKESKMICLVNIVRLCGLPTILNGMEIDELDYLTQITFELYELTKRNGSSDGTEEEEHQYSLRLGFSPGAHDSNLMDLHLDDRHSLSVAPRRWISDHISLDDALAFLMPPANQQSPLSPRRMSP